MFGTRLAVVELGCCKEGETKSLLIPVISCIKLRIDSIVNDPARTVFCSEVRARGFEVDVVVVDGVRLDATFSVVPAFVSSAFFSFSRSLFTR